MWMAIELETDRSKLINHYFPIPEQYTSEDAFVRLIKPDVLCSPVCAVRKFVFVPICHWTTFLSLNVCGYIYLHHVGTEFGY